jgi:hypothetical protein
MRKAAYQVLGVLMMGTWLAAQNVGIGTTTPLTRFHVAAGDIFLGDALGNTGYVIHTRPWLGYDLLQITSRAGGNWEWGKGITYVRASGFVGIGQPTPSQRLHIAGSTLTENAYAAKPLELTAGTNCPVIINAPATQVLITPGGADCGGSATITYTATPIEGQYLWITNLSGSNRTFYGFPVRNNEVIGFVYTNAAWRTVGFTDANTFWRLTGNAGTNPANNFIGTTDAQPLVFRTNNAERMRILSDGKVGIGTSTPTSRFHLADGELAMMTPNGNDGFLMALPGNYGYYETWALYGMTGGNLHSAPFLCARRSTNRLGIGTVNPTAQLHTTGTVRFQHYASASSGAVLLVNNSGDLFTTDLTMDDEDVFVGDGTFQNVNNMAWRLTGNFGTNPVSHYIGTTDAQPLVFRTNNAERMRILSDGRVGIGTSTPTQRLHIAGSTLTDNAYAAKPLELTAGTNCPVIINAPATQVLITPGGADCGGSATITYTATPIEGQYLWITNLSGSNRTFYGFPVRNNEVIGFVYTNAAWRTVGFTDANTFWRLTGNAGTNPANNFIGTTDAQPLVFRTNNAERMRILSDGRVGIGTANPTAQLHTTGTVRFQHYASPPSGAVLLVNNSGDLFTSNLTMNIDHVLVGNGTFQNVNNMAWRLTGNAGTNPANNFIGTTDAQPLVFRTNNAERMRILSDGKVGIGTSTPTSRFHLADGELAMMTPTGNDGFLMALPGGYGYYETWALYGMTGGNLHSAPFLCARRSTNRLGIGTVDPTAQLHTTGTVRFQHYASPPSGAVLLVNSSGDLFTSNLTMNIDHVLVGNGTFQDVNNMAWRLTGNAGTNPANNFIGTTDAQPLVIATKNTTTPQPIQIWVGNQETFRFNPPGTSAPAWSIQRGGGDPRGFHAVDLQSARFTATRVASGDYAAIGGGYNNAASGEAATVGGGAGNTATGEWATIGGGQSNTATGEWATIGGGQSNTANGSRATVGGGGGNAANGLFATVGGGDQNAAGGARATVGGGHKNTANGEWATIGGGWDNTASGSRATVGGGEKNTASGQYSVVPGGYSNSANADYNLVFGQSVVPSVQESHRVYFFSPGNSGFLVINRLDGDHPIHVGVHGGGKGNGAHLTDGGTWVNSSSRSFKERFVQYRPAEVLEKILQLPVEGYFYKGTKEYHITPMAEDFYRLFGTGVHEIIETDSTGQLVRRQNPDVDKYLAASDVAGVALLGVQALHEENAQLRQRVADLERENAQLRQQISDMRTEDAQLRSQLQTLSEQVQALYNRHITGMK